MPCRALARSVISTGWGCSVGSLDGVRVLDLSRNLPGPACSWVLAGMGAQVDRVETPGVGDPTRHVPPFVEGAGAFFSAVSRGKRSVGVSLRHPEGPGVIARLAERYDVLIDGFRPGVLEAAGIGPAVLHARNPGLVIARISGFGQTGPWAQRPGHDINYVGLTGLFSGAAEGPAGLAMPTVQVADVGGALVAATGICAALYRREKTGRGEVIDVSLAEAALALLAPHVTSLTAEGRAPAPQGEFLTGSLPVYGTYRCADGKWLTVGALEPKFQASLASQTGAMSRAELEAVFATRPRDAWVELLADACVGPALDPGELADNAHLAARGAVERLAGVSWVRPPLGGPATEGAVPALGEHTDVVLGEAGFSAAEVASLRSGRVIG